MANNERNDSSTDKTENSALDQVEASFNDYIAALNETWEALNTKILDAQTAYNEVYAETYRALAAGEMIDAQAAADDAFKSYLAAIKDVWDEAQTAYTSAYTKYLNDHSGLWKKVDVKTMVPETSAAVSYTTNVVSHYAYNTIGNTNLIANAQVPPWLLTMAS